MEEENRCVICGEVIPEGLQVCYTCTKNIEEGNNFIGIQNETIIDERKKRKNNGKPFNSWLNTKNKLGG